MNEENYLYLVRHQKKKISSRVFNKHLIVVQEFYNIDSFRSPQKTIHLKESLQFLWKVTGIKPTVDFSHEVWYYTNNSDLEKDIFRWKKWSNKHSH
ncbi:MAG: hypothetical protein CMO01_32940 [Thalassobius sp.]|nr:hypothetical protein [Thalassovita sp.]